MNQKLDRYLEALRRTPPPGSGLECHPHLMRIANLGVRAGVSVEMVIADTLAHIPEGGRVITEKEVRDTVEKAAAESGRVPLDKIKGYGTLPLVNGPALVRKLAETAPDGHPDTIKALSPETIPVAPDDQRRIALEALYHPSERVFVGRSTDGRFDGIDTAHNHAKSNSGPMFIPNPLTGEKAYRAGSNTPTMRGDLNVAQYRYVTFEMDETPLTTQVRFWTAAIRGGIFPVVCLTYSGKKSLHALLASGCGSAEEWKSEVYNRFFPSIAQPMGADSSCKNAARISRLPGCKDGDRKYQHLLYLNPELVSLPVCENESGKLANSQTGAESAKV